MVAGMRRLNNRQRPPVLRFGLLELALVPKDHGQVPKRAGHFGMVVAQYFLLYLHRLPAHFLSLRVLALTR